MEDHHLEVKAEEKVEEKLISQEIGSALNAMISSLQRMLHAESVAHQIQTLREVRRPWRPALQPEMVAKT